jgi:HSP20 family protein
MTLYITSPVNRMRRRMMEMLDNDWPSAEREFVFPVDVKSEPDGFEITGLLPGVKAEDLSIQIVNATVTIQGEFKASRDEKAGYLVQERPEGRFYRVINLPDALDSSKTKADLKDGVLVLHVPKAEEARPKTIKITSA